ncbi:MAG: hypothetical protein V9G19_00790 [Tetrasphaera sp.]
MTSKLAARYVVATTRARDAAARKAEEGMATVEWAFVTLMVVAFVLVALSAIGTVGKEGVETILKEAFGKR